MNAIVETEAGEPAAPVLPANPEQLDERICQFLVRKGRLKEADLVRARRVHEEQEDVGLVSLLTRLGLASERDVAEALSELLDLPLLAAKDAPEVPPAGVQLSVRFLKQFHIVPIGESETSIKLLVADPQDTYAHDAVALATGKATESVVGLRTEIDDLIERYYGQGPVPRAGRSRLRSVWCRPSSAR